jgi:hypothetical protein
MEGSDGLGQIPTQQGEEVQDEGFDEASSTMILPPKIKRTLIS